MTPPSLVVCTPCLLSDLFCAYQQLDRQRFDCPWWMDALLGELTRIPMETLEPSFSPEFASRPQQASIDFQFYLLPGLARNDL